VVDNTALAAACAAADAGVVAVFTICPEEWRRHDWAPVKVDLLLRSLADLSRELAAINIPLLIARTPRFDGVPRRLLELADEHRCDDLWLNREHEVDEMRRDEAVRRLFESRGRTVRSFTDQVVIAPESLRTTEGKIYTVFTPFRKRWTAILKEEGGVRCASRPGRQKPLGTRPDPVPDRVAGFDGLKRPDLWPSGERHAHARLSSFVAAALESYAEKRDFPAGGGTSSLSPYLTLGVLSPRQCLRAALEANGGRLDSGSRGTTTWITEIVWREFYRHVLVGYPRVSMGEPFDQRARAVPWRRAERDLERWREGRTGIPIVDAGMRQLAATGWMHNRLRMITAMFLAKNLLIDWRLGERHFMRSLVDGDLASNNGGWQWCASTGTDAAPYFRVFNPVRQGERFDPEGAFIREHVPELAGIEGRAIHLPHERAPAAARAARYPRPMVDLNASRRRAIKAFAAAHSRARGTR
jgi:deoxyribodipyrimidine photo-lyase